MHNRKTNKEANTVEKCPRPIMVTSVGVRKAYVNHLKGLNQGSIEEYTEVGTVSPATILSSQHDS